MILSSEIYDELIGLHKKLESEGKLYTRSQLDVFYDTFYKRFAPDKLKNLDGEELLETLHNHSNKDSLVYWLEFKNDEEFPSRFGSIAGGSALKFGIYKRKETGAWMTGSPANQLELSLEDAVLFARKNRDQLIKGVELLAKLPSDASDEDYIKLQKEMDELAPDISNTAWGHKYFSLNFPDKLSSYHNLGYQRYHLIKLLVIPSSEDGRYILGGRYAAIAKEMNIPANHLKDLLNYRDGSVHRYWRVGTSDGTVPRNRWDLMRDGNCIALGWPEIGDLSSFNHDKDSLNNLRILMAEKYPSNPQSVGRATKQLFNFLAHMSERDLVIAADGGTVLGIGRITGDCYYHPEYGFPHRRPVKWLAIEDWKLQPADGAKNPEGLQTTVHEIKQFHNMVDIERHILNHTPRVIDIVKKPAPGSEINRLSGLPGRIQSILERKGQVILYGPPGTGKTYWAEITALDLAALCQHGIPYKELTDEQKTEVSRVGPDNGGTVRICCFHPGYGYEDFIEGYRPESVNNQMVFNLSDGIFKKICNLAKSNPRLRYFLIIDEINRGDIPRIFGELLTVIEKNKRGKSVILPLSGEAFQVPENVFIIGTMNTADRSIALLDTALRRRFGFVELMPDTSVLGDAVLNGIPLGPWLDSLNKRICESVGRDARNLQIGHSYLLEGGRPVSSFSKFTKLVQEEIIPLLEEYCYEDYSSLEKILGKSLVDINNQVIRHELFEANKKDELIQSLLEPCPDISTTTLAVTHGEENADDESEDSSDAGSED